MHIIIPYHYQFQTLLVYSQQYQMLHQTVLFLLLLIAHGASPPTQQCNPSVQVMLSQPVLTMNSPSVITFPIAHIVIPSIAYSFINFQAAGPMLNYSITISPATGAMGTSLTLTSFNFTVLSLNPANWNRVAISFMLFNTSAEQFAIIQTIAGTNSNTTTGAANAKDVLKSVVTTAPFNLTTSFLLAGFVNGFDIKYLLTTPMWYRPGFFLDFGLFNDTAIWYSIQAVQNTIISTHQLSFLIVNTNISTNTIYRFTKQNAFISSGTPSISIASVSPYDQYCVMAGLRSFRFNYTVTPEFTFAYPTFALSSNILISTSISNFSVNATVVVLYVLQCTAPDIYYKADDGLCYSICPNHYYPSAPYCQLCHYTCNNCTAFLACAVCLDTAQTTKTLAGDFCLCNLGYFDNGLGTCSLCNSSCVSCLGNQNNCTSCHPGFQVNNTFCVEICGDGILYNSACDDGNILSGDGCSSSCTIEDNYTCINGTTTTPSVCSYNQPFVLSFVFSSQNDSNIAHVQLNITPNMTQFSTLNFSQYITLNLPFHTISHSYLNSKLNLTINFTQPINNSYSQIIVSLTPPTSSSDNFQWKPSSVIVPYGTQVALYYDISYSISNIIKIVLIIVEALSFLSLFLTYRKTVVLQFIMVLQIVTLSISYIPQNFTFILSYKYLHHVGINGYNGMYSWITSPIPTQLSLQRLGYYPELFLNYNLMFIVNICVIAIYFILTLIQFKVDQTHSSRLEVVNSFIQSQILPTFILFSLVNLSFAIGVTASSYSSVDSDLFSANYLASNLSIMLCSLFFLSLLCQHYRTNRTSLMSIRRLYNENKGSQLQFIIWIIYKFCIGFIMGVAHNHKNSLIALILLTVGYILYTIIGRFIRTGLLIAQHLYSQVVNLYMCIVLILYRNDMIDQLTINGMIPGFLLALWLVIGLIGILVYTGYSISKTIKLWRKKIPISKMEYFNNKDEMNEHYDEVNRLQESQNKFKRRKRSYNSSNSIDIV